MKKFLSALLAALLIVSFSTGLIAHMPSSQEIDQSDSIIINNNIEIDESISLYDDSVDPGLDGDSST